MVITQRVEDRQGGRVIVSQGIRRKSGGRSGSPAISPGGCRDRLARIKVQIGLDAVETAGPVIPRGLRRQIGSGYLERRGSCRNNLPRLSRISGQLHVLVIDDVTVLVQMELAISGKRRCAALVHTEETRTIDRDIQGVVGRRDIALGKLLLNGREIDPDTDLARPGPGQRGGIDVAEMCDRRLVADRARIRDIVAGRINCLGGCVQPAQCLLECHYLPLTEFVERP